MADQNFAVVVFEPGVGTKAVVWIADADTQMACVAVTAEKYLGSECLCHASGAGYKSADDHDCSADGGGIVLLSVGRAATASE
jgi:hypothetical protein